MRCPPERTQAATQEVRQLPRPARSCRMRRSCPISNITGEGFEEFYEALKAMVAAITPKTAQRHLPRAGGAGVLREGLRHDRRGDSRLRLRRHRR